MSTSKSINANSGFSIRQTNIAKGIACILLLIHHLFYSPKSYDDFTSLCLIGDVPLESIFAVMCKVCVAIFLLLSGYGVNESINHKLKSTNLNSASVITRKSLRLLWKLWANFAFIFIIFVPWQFLTRNPYSSVSDFAADALGLADLLNTPTMNKTWWYISLALLSYLAVLFYKPILNKYRGLAFVIAGIFFVLYIVLGDNLFLCYIFMFGMQASEIGIMNRLTKRKAKRIYKWIMCLSLVAITAILRYIVPAWMDMLFAFSIILFSYVCISEVKFLSNTLELIGKHSANIFMFHSFIYVYNFKEIVYAPKYAPLISIAFVIECLIISIAIEYIKKITFAERGINFIGNLIEGKKS